MIFEGGGLKFELVEGWGKVPESIRLGPDIPTVATDSRDRVYVFNRAEHPVVVFESDGRFLGTWGEKVFTGRPHGISITPDDIVYCTDDLDHTVRKFTTDGKLLQTLGTPNKPSDSGYVPNPSHSLVSIKRGAGPFNRPTKVALAPNGDLYITDGYGNARVHRFTAAGKLIQSWGSRERGAGSSTCLTACGSITTAGCSYVTGRTRGCKSSAPQANTWVAGMWLDVHKTCPLTKTTMCSCRSCSG